MEAFATLRILPVPTHATSAVSYAHSLRRFGYHGPWPLASRSAALRISTTSSQAVLLVSKVHSLGGIDGRSSSALSYVHRSTLCRSTDRDRVRNDSRERHLVGREEQDSAGRDSVGHASKQCLIFATLEERAMRDDIESPREPLTDKAPVHRLRLLELLLREVSKASDRLDQVIQIEHSHLPASAAKPPSQCAHDGALA